MNDASPPEQDDLFVIGIGASAGGLEAIRALLKSAPKDVAATYIIAQHMSPTHRSMLTLLIDRETHLQVTEIAEPAIPRRNHVYVTPPNTDVVYENGKVRLVEGPMSRTQPKPSVDRLFRSIAEEAGTFAIGVVLSGTGSDGSLGVKAIREAGGITFAQDDKTSKYDGMPNSAIETGCVDLIMSPIEIASRLPMLSGARSKLAEDLKKDAPQPPLTEIMTMLLARTRVDFRDYKPTTILRRLERRMTAMNTKSQAEYARHCQDHPEELDALFKDLLISVTRFFRDPAQFEALQTYVKEIVETAGARPVRIWIAGCATGEEAYSIAILFCEAMGGIEEAVNRELKIFASDIDEHALSVARTGRYPANALDDLPEDFGERYFDVEDELITVHPDLKRLILFSYHNVVQDPPFISLDLICCRNLLIYFGPILQDKALSNFHYALREHGSLFLGTTESASVSDDLFESTKSTANVLRRRNVPGVDYQVRSRHLPYLESRREPIRDVAQRDKSERLRADNNVNALVRAIVAGLGGRGLLLTSDLKMLSVFGDLTSLVTLKDGAQLGFNHTLLVEPLAEEIRVLATVAVKTMRPQKGFARSIGESVETAVRMEVIPLAHTELREDLLLVLLHDEDVVEQQPAFAEQQTVYQGVGELERELFTTKEALRHAVAEWETANEELESMNEELQSNNEELQSMNEELETANEELQSTNEELITNNESLQITSGELTHITDELTAILQQLETPLLIIGKNLSVEKLSDSAMEMFGVKSRAGATHLSQLALPEGFPALAPICDEVLRLGVPQVKRIVSGRGTYRLNCTPYSTARRQINGATMIFTDISAGEEEV